MVIPEKEFELAINYGRKKVLLNGTSLPLHYYGIEEDTRLCIIKSIASRIIEIFLFIFFFLLLVSPHEDDTP